MSRASPMQVISSLSVSLFRGSTLFDGQYLEEKSLICSPISSVRCLPSYSARYSPPRDFAPGDIHKCDEVYEAGRRCFYLTFATHDAAKYVHRVVCVIHCRPAPGKRYVCQGTTLMALHCTSQAWLPLKLLHVFLQCRYFRSFCGYTTFVQVSKTTR